MIEIFFLQDIHIGHKKLVTTPVTFAQPLIP